jgi:hypothetical protein
MKLPAHRSGSDSNAGAGDRAYHGRWNWVQFTCAFLLAGALAFLHVSPSFDGLAVHLAKTFGIALACAAVAGRFGDSAWQGIVSFFHWL